ncbi:hypothetical protein OG607_19965 [Streptomyces sp. NBC_01537]|uniref:hypothetical protein n=1 Tax=Streptomyces sp. NBC_01537 TaxID=2903896 RepID=UPI00386E88CA
MPSSDEVELPAAVTHDTAQNRIWLEIVSLAFDLLARTAKSSAHSPSCAFVTSTSRTAQRHNRSRVT